MGTQRMLEAQSKETPEHNGRRLAFAFLLEKGQRERIQAGEDRQHRRQRAMGQRDMQTKEVSPLCASEPVRP